ncbi:hypothetical protein [Paracoccus alkanivorans]|uniref:Uncharacterized protein n=1 Tax=Paracoccus alkanivorans TaxID=2116655 RepID=A0A3M0MAU5_9RHOB|nr:hypothetical protein [Paracoccus alkanivorans]RMC34926.1 hypothetical protein C9E81_12620 [Paracoccus alkanivorans]
MKHTLILIPLLLASCAEPMIRDSDVIRRAADPAYIHGEAGIVPVSCQGNLSSYSSRPSGCQRDLVFASQVANPADLIDPVSPGPGPAGPVGRAADAYINPDPAAGTGATVPNLDLPGTPRRIYPQQAAPYDPYAGMTLPR